MRALSSMARLNRCFEAPSNGFSLGADACASRSAKTVFSKWKYC